MSKIVNDAISLAKSKYLKSLSELTPNELHNVISTAVMSEIADDWMNFLLVVQFIITLFQRNYMMKLKQNLMNIMYL